MLAERLEHVVDMFYIITTRGKDGSMQYFSFDKENNTCIIVNDFEQATKFGTLSEVKSFLHNFVEMIPTKKTVLYCEEVCRSEVVNSAVLND